MIKVIIAIALFLLIAWILLKERYENRKNFLKITFLYFLLECCNFVISNKYKSETKQSTNKKIKGTL